MISIQYQGSLYNISQEPFETVEDSYKRGWYIVKNYNKFENYQQLYSESIIMLNTAKGMTY
jgi:L-amino acid N-acyltransferase YncA